MRESGVGLNSSRHRAGASSSWTSPSSTLSASRDSKSTEAAGLIRGYLLLTTTLQLLALLEPTRVFHKITCPVGYRGSIFGAASVDTGH